VTPARPRPPVDCPVCGVAVAVTRLSCDACGTELTGRFAPCGLCALPDDDIALVRALLAAGGDAEAVGRTTGLGLRGVQRRLREASLRLGGEGVDEPAEPSAVTGPEAEGAGEGDDFLDRLARGVVEADEALRRLP
jgi:hypothetical protein